MFMAMRLTSWHSLTIICFFFKFRLSTLDCLIIELSICFWRGYPGVTTKSHILHVNLGEFKFFLTLCFHFLHCFIHNVITHFWVIPQIHFFSKIKK
jgi:hypothetical protein